MSQNEITKTSVNTTYSKCAIVCVLIATILQSIFGFARDATPFFKLMIAIFCFLSVILTLFDGKRKTQVSPVMKYTILLLQIHVFVCFLISLLYGHVYNGNKYIVLLTNMYCILNLLSIFLVRTISNYSELRLLLNCTIIFIFVSVLLLVFNYNVTVDSYILTYILPYCLLFFPYIGNGRKFILLFGIVISIFTYLGGGRQVLLTLFYCFIAFVVQSLGNKKITLITSILMILTPLAIILISVASGSIIENFSDSHTIASANPDEDLSTDTRTFLYAEFFVDFLRKSNLVKFFGQGAIAYYHSDFFLDGQDGSFGERLGIEVPVLQWLLQGGIYLFLLITFIVILAIYRYYKFGRNSLCQMSMLLISGYYLSCYISNFVGFNISHLGIWTLIGLSQYDRFLLLSDRCIRLKLFQSGAYVSKRLQLKRRAKE